jgi:hypothetical protein
MSTKNWLKENHLMTNEIFLEISMLLCFIGIGTIGRILLVGWNFQPFPNFEIIMVITFLAVIFLKPALAIFVPIVSMILSDLLLGNAILVGNQMNRIVLFTYSGFVMIALLGISSKNRWRKHLARIRLKSIGVAAGLGIGFVLIYDVWTNIGWWYLIYPHTIEHLAGVFTAGIPFMIYHMISGVVTFVAVALPVLSMIKHEVPAPLRIKNVQRAIVAAVAVALIGLSFTGTAVEVPEKSEIWLEQTDETSVTMIISGDNWQIEDNIVAYPEDTVFTILEAFAERNKITCKYTYYEEFDSVLIDSINGDVNGDEGRYWQYYVNDKIPMIGCDKYNVSNGDVIQWKFETLPY